MGYVGFAGLFIESQYVHGAACHARPAAGALFPVELFYGHIILLGQRLMDNVAEIGGK